MYAWKIKTGAIEHDLVVHKWNCKVKSVSRSSKEASNGKITKYKKAWGYACSEKEHFGKQTGGIKSNDASLWVVEFKIKTV